MKITSRKKAFELLQYYKERYSDKFDYSESVGYKKGIQIATELSSKYLSTKDKKYLLTIVKSAKTIDSKVKSIGSIMDEAVLSGDSSTIYTLLSQNAFNSGFSQAFADNIISLEKKDGNKWYWSKNKILTGKTAKIKRSSDIVDKKIYQGFSIKDAIGADSYNYNYAKLNFAKAKTAKVDPKRFFGYEYYFD